MSNADLYNTMTPPAYTQSVAGSEVLVEATAYEQEKLGLHNANINTQTYHDNADSPGTVRADSPHLLPISPGAGAPNSNAQVNNGHFTKPTNEAALAYVRRCSVLPDQLAVWLVKRKNFALSSLAAAVLIKEGLMRSKDLVLCVHLIAEPNFNPNLNLRYGSISVYMLMYYDSISQGSGIKRDPTDPLSAVCFATYDTVGDVMNGLIAGPMEACRQVTPMLVKYEERQNNLQTPNVRTSVLQESTPLSPQQSHSQSQHQPEMVSDPAQVDGSATTLGVPVSPEMQLQPDHWAGSEQPNICSDAPPSQRRNSTLEAAPNAAKQVAIGTGKGLGRIIGAGLKAPMTFTHGISRGFHNAPKLYGEQVREYENITDLRSGLSVSAKGFGHGISDGLSDFFVKPIQGAQKEGVKGFAKGCGKGVGNLVCKPTSGAIGLVGYSFVGVYKQLQGINFSSKDSAGDIVRYQGEAEYEHASKELKLEVVNRWCQVMMRQTV
jgi:hypothetical protein